MNIQEYLLTCLGEEGSEVAQDCSKAMRFGFRQKSTLEPDGPNNMDRLLKEVNEFIAVVNLMVNLGIIPEDWEDAEIQNAKKDRVLLFMNKSRELGTLNE